MLFISKRFLALSNICSKSIESVTGEYQSIIIFGLRNDDFDVVFEVISKVIILNEERTIKISIDIMDKKRFGGFFFVSLLLT